MSAPDGPSMSGLDNALSPGWTVRLARRPEGTPDQDCFRVQREAAPQPGPGQVLVRNLYLSVDPYMRGRMSSAKSYVAPYAIDAILEGGAVGVVRTSRIDGVAEGSLVVHQQGWREWAVLAADRMEVVDGTLGPPSAYLGALGMPGLTAYAGIVDIADVRPGEAVLVSGAAGAVGSVAGQIARLRGAGRVVGIAGSDEKVAYLTEELGFDAGINYRDGDLRAAIREAAGKIDVFFDNVGGEQLELAISAMNPFGRIALCGSISTYNEPTPPPGPRNLGMLTGKSITMRGYLVSNHLAETGEFRRAMSSWLATGRVKTAETVLDGVERTPAALIELLGGRNLGKMLVRVAPESAPADLTNARTGEEVSHG